MIKKIAAISASVLILTGCVSSANASEFTVAKTSVNMIQKTPTVMDHIQSISRQTQLNTAIAKLKKTVGKTWYVFSGATPSGWDCSGLTLWTYQQLGINLEHRASKQQNSGIKVSTPKYGDLVVFTYKGYKSAYHVGVYIGNGLMIHAPKKGQVTRVESVDTFAGRYSKISYRRLFNSL